MPVFLKIIFSAPVSWCYKHRLRLPGGQSQEAGFIVNLFPGLSHQGGKTYCVLR